MEISKTLCRSCSIPLLTSARSSYLIRPFSVLSISGRGTPAETPQSVSHTSHNRNSWIHRGLFHIGIYNKQIRWIRSHAKISPTRYYDVLGLTPRATQKQIKSAYYNMSKMYHPDVSKDDKSHALFTEISEAYEVLGNLRTRKMYDRGIYTRDNSLNSAESAGEEDYTAAYRAKQSPFERGDRPPPPRGRSNIYNFDEFYKQHYNELRERRFNEYQEFVQQSQKMQGGINQNSVDRMGSQSNIAQSIFLATTLLIVLLVVSVSMENYDRDLIGQSRRGSAHPNYYGAYDTFRKLPTSRENKARDTPND